MKKNCYLLLFLLVLSASAKAQTNWVTKNLDNRVSVKFPAEPQKVNKNGFDSYVVKGSDSIRYTSTVVDYQIAAHLDSATLAPLKDTQEFADQMRMGIAAQKPNYTFGNLTIGKWNTYTLYSLNATDNTTKSTLTMQMILIGSKMYSLTCSVPAGVVTKNNEVFFASANVVK